MPLATRRYFQHVRMFSRNAKLYLVATILQGLAFGIWGVIFNLYLELPEVGFQSDFVGNMFSVSAIATGFIALPAGIFCQYLGSKKALLIGLTANLINLIQIVVLQPSILLVASLTSGLIGTISWVASAPFMTENSRQDERTHLFSVAWAAMIIMGVIGSYAGGVMPDLFNASLGMPTGGQASALGYRITLGISVVLALMAFIPILLIREGNKLKRQKMVELVSLRNIQSSRTILKFMIPTGIIGFGAGFIVPLFNIFFNLKFSASDEAIGIIFALGNVATGVGTLSAPFLSKKLGRVKSVVICQFLSMPFIMLMTATPHLAFASAAYIFRGALMNMAGPITTTLEMELVTESERATTNGLMVMADNVPRAITASISGKMMTVSDFFSPFLFTTVTYFVASSLFFAFFRRVEAQTSSVSETVH